MIGRTCMAWKRRDVRRRRGCSRGSRPKPAASARGSVGDLARPPDRMRAHGLGARCRPVRRTRPASHRGECDVRRAAPHPHQHRPHRGCASRPGTTPRVVSCGDRPCPPEPAGGGECAGAGRLACELDALRRAVAELEPVPEQVEALAKLVGELSQALAAVTARRRIPAAPSWLLAPTDPDHTRGCSTSCAPVRDGVPALPGRGAGAASSAGCGTPRSSRNSRG
ncbi:hypothetical protein HBB16_04990 [Pseudonocardia sp. MCCB 268]|nr:hypothetical protein [Pseudonocardia cytotoxica]